MSKPMTKTQLVAAMAEEMGTDKKTGAAALDAIIDIITKEVSAGGAVTLPRRQDHVPRTSGPHGA